MVETFVVIENIDNSILLLNDYLVKDGYEFIEIELSKLEMEFGDLFGLSKQYDKSEKINMGNQVVSRTFFDLFLKSPLASPSFVNDGKVVLLKRSKPITIEESKVSNDVLFNTHMYCLNLVKKLRLFKCGNIRLYQVFQKVKATNNIFCSTGTFYKSVSSKIFTINDEDIDLLQVYLEEIEEVNFDNISCKLGAENFNLAYEISNLDMKFITLMTVLESIFNSGQHQITHIVSRHLALIISNNKKEFQENYKKIKSLYGLRSKIVHGNEIKTKDKLTENLMLLEDLVRKALKFCIKNNKNKKELFDFFNAKGF